MGGLWECGWFGRSGEGECWGGGFKVSEWVCVCACRNGVRSGWGWIFFKKGRFVEMELALESSHGFKGSED